MPFKSKKQQRWAYGPGGKDAGFTDKKLKEWSDKTDFDSLPEEASEDDAERSKRTSKAMKKVSRDSDPYKGKRRGGYHSTPKGGKGYDRKEKHRKPITEGRFWTAADIGDVMPQQPNQGDLPMQEKIPGGKGAGVPDSYFDPEELRMGIEEESGEHTPDKNAAKEIAKDHLMEDPHYYTNMRGSEDQANSQELTPIDETYRHMKFPLAEAAWFVESWKDERNISTVALLNWSTHKAETFNDTGAGGDHPAWGMKSIIDRGVKTHEKPEGDKRIGEADHQTQKRNYKGKTFKSYSMVNAFNW